MGCTPSSSSSSSSSKRCKNMKIKHIASFHIDSENTLQTQKSFVSTTNSYDKNKNIIKQQKPGSLRRQNAVMFEGDSILEEESIDENKIQEFNKKQEQIKEIQTMQQKIKQILRQQKYEINTHTVKPIQKYIY